MKSKQIPTGQPRQQSIKQFDAAQSTASKRDRTCLVAGPQLMAAIKQCVRPVVVD